MTANCNVQSLTDLGKDTLECELRNNDPVCGLVFLSEISAGIHT